MATGSTSGRDRRRVDSGSHQSPVATASWCLSGTPAAIARAVESLLRDPEGRRAWAGTPPPSPRGFDAAACEQVFHDRLTALLAAGHDQADGVTRVESAPAEPAVESSPAVHPTPHQAPSIVPVEFGSLRRQGPVTKDPQHVIHTLDALEAYLDEMCLAEGITFDQWFAMFGQGLYTDRNEQILSLLLPLKPRRIFEFACAGGFLAQLLLERISTIEEYVCSNFSTRMLDYTRNQLRQYSKCSVQRVDADVRRSEEMTGRRISGTDTFITTSFEHIQFDRELIAQLPVGATFVFSVALLTTRTLPRVRERETSSKRAMVTC